MFVECEQFGPGTFGADFVVDLAATHRPTMVATIIDLDRRGEICCSESGFERILRDGIAFVVVVGDRTEKRGLIMISEPSSESELSVWRPLILRRFQPAIHTRIGGVCLFDGGMVPSGTKTGWEIQAHLVLNPHAASPLPSWIEEAVIGADDAFESSFSKTSTD